MAYIEVSNVRHINADDVRMVYVANVGGATPYSVRIVLLSAATEYDLPGMAYAVQSDAERTAREVVRHLGATLDPNELA